MRVAVLTMVMGLAVTVHMLVVVVLVRVVGVVLDRL